MCTRFLLLRAHLTEMLDRLGLRGRTEFASRYNIAPSTRIPALRGMPETGAYDLVELRWGLIPSWSKPEAAASALINARAETVAEKPSFRDAFRKRRCLIPASGFYEWKALGRARQPWLFRRRDEQPFFLAGLWESWAGPDGLRLETCVVITTASNSLMSPIHDRMPVMLPMKEGLAWLDASTDDQKLQSMLINPFPAAEMTATALTSRVNSVAHDDPDCLQPADTAGTEDQQLFEL